jgi:hypothetical protein
MHYLHSTLSVQVTRSVHTILLTTNSFNMYVFTLTLHAVVADVLEDAGEGGLVLVPGVVAEHHIREVRQQLDDRAAVLRAWWVQ